MLQKKLSVLTIEDEIDFRKSVVAYLQDKGFNVFEANNGHEGLELVKNRKLDLVLTDLKMAGLGGVALIMEVQKIKPNLPIIVISGEGLDAETVRAVQAGAWDYIPKPIMDFKVLDGSIKLVFAKFERMWREKEVRQGLENLLEKQKKQLVEITSYDPTTNLPLRKEFISLANKTVNRIGICDAQVVMIGLKNLAKINNTYGHDIGSLALKKFVKRLKPKLPAETVIGRISDDQIALFLVNRSRNGALIKFILGLSKKVFVVAEHDLPINLSIGISTNQLKCFSAEKILRESSLAQCWARQIGNNQVVHYSDKLENENLKRLMMENALRRALTNNEFIIHYQPQFSTNNRALTGCEALLRWKPTEQAELVSPLEFIPVLEETGLIESVGAWCLEEACGQYVLWREAGVQPFTPVRQCLGGAISFRKFSENRSACPAKNPNGPLFSLP